MVPPPPKVSGPLGESALKYVVILMKGRTKPPHPPRPPRQPRPAPPDRYGEAQSTNSLRRGELPDRSRGARTASAGRVHPGRRTGGHGRISSHDGHRLARAIVEALAVHPPR